MTAVRNIIQDIKADRKDQQPDDEDFPDEPTYTQLKERIDATLNDIRQHNTSCRSEKRKQIQQTFGNGSRSFFQRIKGDYRDNNSVIIDPVTNLPTTYLPRIHQIFREQWEPIFNMHKHNKPCWKNF